MSGTIDKEVVLELEKRMGEEITVESEFAPQNSTTTEWTGRVSDFDPAAGHGTQTDITITVSDAEKVAISVLRDGIEVSHGVKKGDEFYWEGVGELKSLEKHF